MGLVSSELVSGVSSLIYSENAGKSPRYDDLGATISSNSGRISGFSAKFPKADNRESLRHDQGLRFSAGTLALWPTPSILVPVGELPLDDLLNPRPRGVYETGRSPAISWMCP